MTKLRTPLTHAAAVKKIADFIGADAAAALFGFRGARVIYDWSDSDCRKLPSLEQAVALDAAYIRCGGTGAPMRDAHEAMLCVATGVDVACQRELAAAIAEASTEVGDAIAAVIPLVQPGASPHQRFRALRESEQAHGAVGRLLRTVKSFLPSGGQAEGAS